MALRGIGLAAALTLAASPAWAQQAPSTDQTVRVRFAAGSTGAQYRGTLRGYQGVNYVVRAQAGQRLTVQLRTGNPFAYFNIWAPGSDTAAFIGSQGASETEATGGGYSHDMPVTVTGEQRIQVYLMRNAARRGERAPYTIDIAVYGAGEAAPTAN